MKRHLLLALAASLTLFAQAQTQMELSAREVSALMAPGWNLGNTMEAAKTWEGVALYNNKGGVGSETAWQPTKTTQAVIDFVKSQGFRSVRIPCAWVLGHISDAQAYTIDKAWMARVKEVVDYCINADLYVVLNDHWDGGWLEEHIKDSGATKTKNQEVLKAIWTQIAEVFKDYDERLLFAGLNEPNADNQAATNNLVEYEQIFIDAVRSTGGNNAQRVLIVQGPNTDIDKTNSYYNTLPKDPATDRLMVEVHYYTPYQFTMMEKDESWGKYMNYWGTGNNPGNSARYYNNGEAEMERLLKKMKTKFVDKGIPVYIGEYAANWKTVSGAGESQEKHDASIKLFHQKMVEYCMSMGMVPVVWDTNNTSRPCMTVIDRRNGGSVYSQPMMEGIREGMAAHISPVISPPSSSAVYDLQGRKVCGTPANGIYIQDGRKFVVR